MSPDALQVLGTYENGSAIDNRLRIGALVLFGLSLIACEGAPARSKPWRHAPDAGGVRPRSATAPPVLAGEGARLRALAARRDTLTVWLDSDPRELDPVAAPSAWTARITTDTVLESLLHYRPGESDARPGAYEPRLAASWKVGEGGREIAFELQPQVRFHDGRLLEASDVQRSIEAARRAAGRGGGDLADVAGVDVVGPRAVKVRLARPNAYALRALAEVAIAPAPAPGAAPAAGLGLIGTGPYKVRRWDEGTIELERFAGYWGRKPTIANLVFRHEADAAAALRLARSGEIDVLPALIREHRGEETRGAGAAAAGLAPLRLHPPIMRALVMNARKPPFDDVRVRCAVARWLDRSLLVAAGKRMNRAAGGAIWPGGPGDGPAMEAPPLDRAGAAALLEQAGWRDEDRDGIRARTGARLLVTILVSDRQDEERDQVLEQLRAAGFAIDARVGTTAVLDNRLRDGKFDAAFVEWRARPGEDLGPVYGTGGSLNFGGFSEPRVDEALAGLRQSWEASARWRGMRRLGALLGETCPVAPLVAPEPHGLISRRVRGAVVSGGWLDLRGASLAPPDESKQPAP
jgi:peptide/nickel transport system substrate-binding protein